MSRNTLTKRTAAIICALGISLAPATVGITFAQDAPTPTVAPGNINFNENGSITIHKLIGSETGTPADGTENPPTGTYEVPTADDAVTYTVKKLDADLSTPAGFVAAQELDVDSPRDASFTARTGQINDSGDVTFGGLPIGVYVVTEEVSESSALVPADPFIVFVPMTGPNGENWNYDVHVYPKNTTAGTDKTVFDANQNQGSTITYTINSDVPAVPSGATMRSFRVTDSLDSRLTVVENGVRVSLSDGTELDGGD